MKTTLLFTALAVAGMLQAFSIGSPNRTEVGTTASAIANDDADFAKEAAMGGMAEVALGKLAAEKGMDQRVKDFGAMMVKEHGKANEELKGIARSKKIDLPTELDAEHKALADKLGKLSGKDFDEAYVKEMLEDHKKDLKVFQSEAANGSDAEIKAFASKTATVIQKHLTAIQKIHDSM